MLIGIDVGTTAVKAGLFDFGGRAHRHFSQAYPTARPSAGHVEQDPRHWLDLVLKALAELSSGVKVVAVGLCSQVNTHVFVNARGVPLLPAFTWQDTRCAAEAATLDGQISVNEKLSWWGAPLPVDASHVLSRMAHVAAHMPAVWNETRHVLVPKDYCLLHLTGEPVADPMTNFGILDQSLRPIAPLIALVDGARQRLPRIAPLTEVAGRIRPGLPCAGVPVVTGTMDAWSGLLGAGVSRDGQGLYLSGTSEILGIVSSMRNPAPGVIAFPACEGIVLHAGPTQSGGASLAWVARLLGTDPAGISSLAAAADARHVPLFLPHLDGERSPLWDAGAKGSFTGLTSAAGPMELACAVLEGVAYSARLVFEMLEQSAGRGAGVIHHSGGGSASDVWCQIRADVLGRALRRTTTRDAGVLGAALMAGVGCGAFPSLEEAASGFVKFDRTFLPREDAGTRHAARFGAYKLAYEQLKPVNRALAG